MCTRTTRRKQKEEICQSNISGRNNANMPAPGAADALAQNASDKFDHADADASAASAPVTDPSQYANWPLKNIRDPSPNDILYGRGGGTNHHPGNKRYRKLVEDRKIEYVNSKRLDKPVVALDIVKKWRSQSPPGRFLKMDDKTGLWSDVGDKKAREKTSQALREKAPQIRRELEEAGYPGEVSLLACCFVWIRAIVTSYEHGNNLTTLHCALQQLVSHHSIIQDGDQRSKKTTFNVPKGGGVPKSRDDLNHLMLARDHSLGRDYLQPGEAVEVGGFDWEEPVGKLSAEDADTPPPAVSPGHRGGRYHHPDQAGAAGGRSGWGSGQFAFIEPSASKSPQTPQKRYSPPSREGSGSYYPPPAPLPGGDVRVMSASTFPGPPPAGAYPYPPGGSFPPPPQHPGVPRDHSLAGYPLRNASIGSSARDSFAGSDAERSRSYDEAYWQGHQQYGPPPPPGGYAYPPPSPYQGSPRHSYAPNPQDYHHPSSHGYQDAFDRRASNSDIPQPPLPPQQQQQQQQQQWSGQSSDYQRVADIIGQGGDKMDPHGYKRSHSKSDGKHGPAKPKGGLRRKISGGGVIPSPPDGAIDELKASLPRPEKVKRDTSHQCETEETKRRVQRSRLHREHSLAGVALIDGDIAHEALSPREYEFSDPSSKASSEMGGVSSDLTMRTLSKSMRQSSIGDNNAVAAAKNATKPPNLSAGQRLTTVDAVRMAFLGSDDGLDGCADDANKFNEDPNVGKVTDSLVDGKPGALTASDRITTSDALSFAGIAGDQVLDVEKKPLPLADELRLSTGGTVDAILASVEETVGGVLTGLDSGVDSVINGLGKPPSISTNGRMSTADSILTPPDANDLAADFLAKDSGLE